MAQPGTERKTLDQSGRALGPRAMHTRQRLLEESGVGPPPWRTTSLADTTCASPTRNAIGFERVVLPNRDAAGKLELPVHGIDRVSDLQMLLVART